MSTTCQINVGDCREVLRTLPERSVHTLTIPEMRHVGLPDRAARAQSKLNRHEMAERAAEVVDGLSDAQLAYIAGLIDGEGSVESQKQMQRGGKTPLFALRVSFVMATYEPLATVAGWLDLVVKEYPATDERRQSRKRLSIPKGTVVPLLERLMPFLILKRRQAEIVLAIESVRRERSPGRGGPPGPGRQIPADAITEMDALHRELRSLKSTKRPERCR